VLDADLGHSARIDDFEARHPERFLQMGVAEQYAVGVASGLAYGGYHPIFASMAMFSLALPWTQLRQAAYAGLPTTRSSAPTPGSMWGLTVERIRCLKTSRSRVLPEVTVLAPCDTPRQRRRSRPLQRL
jgi:transketolase